MTNRTVFLILGTVIITIALGGFFYFQKYQEQQAEIKRLEAIAEQERQRARAAEEARREQEERKLAEERRKQAEREQIRRLERERQIEKERQVEAERRRIAEERKRKIITFTQADDNDPRPFGIRLDIPAQLGDRIRLLSDLIVRSDNRQQGAVVINNKTACCQKGSDIIFLKRGNIYQLTNSTIISITRSGANWVRLEKPLRLEVISD